MKNNAMARCCVTVMPLVLMGCAALDTAHYAWPGPGRTDVVSVDAKLRHLIMNHGEEGFKVCAEAAPDAFSAFGSSLSGGLGIGATDRKAEAASAFATTAATIERTQTYNLLRESFYRTCERWLSGAITRDQFMTLAARDHRSMVAVLAIEQMTGVVKAPATIISGPAVSASRAQSEKLLEVLAVYQKERKDADDAATAATSALVTANVLYPDNDPAAKPICTITPPPTDATAKAKYETCKAAESKSTDTKAVAKAAGEREKKVLDQLEALAAGLSAATKPGTNTAGGLDYEKQQISDVKMALIAQSVEKIALTAGIDETLMFCMNYLRSIDLMAGDTTRQACNDILKSRAAADAQTLRSITDADNSAALSILDNSSSPGNVAQANLAIARYRAFITGLQLAVAATNDADWGTRWGAFIETSGLATNQCPSRAACLALLSRGETPFNLQYNRNQENFDRALEAWTAALREPAKAEGEN